MSDTTKELIQQAESIIAKLRETTDEPFSIGIGYGMDVELRPSSWNEARVIVGHQERGDVTINHTPEGLILDVTPKDEIDVLHTVSIPAEDLIAQDDKVYTRAEYLAMSAGAQLHLLQADADLIPEQLDDKYNQEGGGEHPAFPRAFWRQDVSNGDTLLGYWEWTAHRIEETVTEILNHERP